MSTYQIQGTVSLKYDGNLSVLLTPAAGYVSPDKKYAIFFPASDDESPALMKKIEDKAIEIKLPKCKSVLIAAANSQKIIQLEVDDQANMIGFTYPAQ